MTNMVSEEKPGSALRTMANWGKNLMKLGGLTKLALALPVIIGGANYVINQVNNHMDANNGDVFVTDNTPISSSQWKMINEDIFKLPEDFKKKIGVPNLINDIVSDGKVTMGEAQGLHDTLNKYSRATYGVDYDQVNATVKPLDKTKVQINPSTLLSEKDQLLVLKQASALHPDVKKIYEPKFLELSEKGQFSYDNYNKLLGEMREFQYKNKYPIGLPIVDLQAKPEGYVPNLKRTQYLAKEVPHDAYNEVIADIENLPTKAQREKANLLMSKQLENGIFNNAGYNLMVNAIQDIKAGKEPSIKIDPHAPSSVEAQDKLVNLIDDAPRSIQKQILSDVREANKDKIITYGEISTLTNKLDSLYEEHKSGTTVNAENKSNMRFGKL